MSTVSTVPVNGGVTEGLWLTVSELARSKKIDKAAVSRRLAKFEAEGLVSTKPGPRGSKLVNAAEYDKAAGEMGDTLRAAPPLPTAEPGGGEPSDASRLTSERARREGYEAEMARLRLEERQRKLLPLDEVVAAITAAATVIVQKIDQLPSRADDVAAAVAKDGAAGARSTLKVLAFELRTAIAKHFDANSIAAASPAGVGDGYEGAEDLPAIA